MTTTRPARGDTRHEDEMMSETFLIADIPDVLRRMRHAKGQTLKQASETAGISVSYLSDIETGRTTPAINTLRELVAVNGYTLTFSLESEDKPFEMFGFVETQLLYALEAQDYRKALVLLASLVPDNDDDDTAALRDDAAVTP